MDATSPRVTIGVFDSGFGGLTVLRQLLPLIPGAHYVYLGDTARLPYGSKSRATIARYAVESARFLESHGANHLVIACNTASALALDDIRASVKIPVTGVIEPGARSAWAALASRVVDPVGVDRPQDRLRPDHREVMVLATQATVSSHAYDRACAALGLRAVEKACPLLVPLVEEGWIDHPVTREVIRIYLTEAIGDGAPNVVLLGCTHYPLIEHAIRAALRELGHSIEVIDSARATALVVSHGIRNRIDARPIRPGENAEKVASKIGRDFSPGIAGAESMRALAPGTRFSPLSAQDPPFFEASDATFECYATDSTEKFARLGSQFLGQPIPQVKLLDLGG